MSDWDTPSPLSPVDQHDVPDTMDMPSTAASQDQRGVIYLGVSPDAQIVREAFLALPTIEDACIDASEVERLPGSVLQVLLAAMRDAASLGRKLSVVNPSFAFTLVFEAFGLGGDKEPFIVEYR